MTTLLATRRFLNDYARNPVNLLLLAIVPVVFVVVVASSLADTAKLLGGTGGIAVETATAGWAAAFLAGIAMYFQTASTRETDRRLVIAGLPAGGLVLARLLTGLTLAGLASAAALIALTARTGIQHPTRAIFGTLMFAIIYVAIGAVVGALAHNPVNGTVVILFVWILDVFFGPAMASADRLATRALPTHFATLWMVDLPSRHSGQLGDLGWALAWTLVAASGAWIIVVVRTRTGRSSRLSGRHHRAGAGQLPAALRAAWRDGRRNPAQWALFVVVPIVFILTAAAVTPDKPITVFLDEHGRRFAKTLPMPNLHSATMAPIAIASLAALIGMFVLLDSRAADNRVALAGLRPLTLFTGRLAVLAVTVLTAVTVSLLTTALVFDASRWPTYIGANLLIGLTYALVGALLAPIFGRVGGVFLAFLLPFIDLGIVQSPMLHPTPTTVAMYLPGYGGSRVLLDGALTRGFDETTPLLIGISWLVVLFVTVAWVYRRSISPPARDGVLPDRAGPPAPTPPRNVGVSRVRLVRWVLIVGIGLFGLLTVPSVAWAHGGGETEEGYLLVEQALGHLAHDTTHVGITLAMEKVNDALATKDQEGVDVPKVKAAMTALEAGQSDKARGLLQDSIKRALDDQPPATGNQTGTTLVLTGLPGRSGIGGQGWGFLVASVALLPLGVGLAFRYRPKDTVGDLRRTLAPLGAGEGPAQGPSDDEGGRS